MRASQILTGLKPQPWQQAHVRLGFGSKASLSLIQQLSNSAPMAIGCLASHQANAQQPLPAKSRLTKCRKAHLPPWPWRPPGQPRSPPQRQWGCPRQPRRPQAPRSRLQHSREGRRQGLVGEGSTCRAAEGHAAARRHGMEAEQSRAAAAMGAACGQPGSSAMPRPAPVAWNARAYSRVWHRSAGCSTHPGCPQRRTPHPYRPCQTPPPALALASSDHCTARCSCRPSSVARAAKLCGGGGGAQRLCTQQAGRRVCTSSRQCGLAAASSAAELQITIAQGQQAREGQQAGGSARARRRGGRACRGALTTIDSPFLTLSPGDLSQDTILPSARASTK